ncbi:MAG TPA: hypothetical protein VEC06_17250 [Paucimonas sp.]|nr:hypothetical protein [Paucimonas sp.]
MEGFDRKTAARNAHAWTEARFEERKAHGGDFLTLATCGNMLMVARVHSPEPGTAPRVPAARSVRLTPLVRGGRELRLLGSLRGHWMLRRR